MNNRRTFLKNAAGLLGGTLLLPKQYNGLFNLSPPPSGLITLDPTASRFIYILHEDWNLMWSIQFPEIVSASKGLIMDWPRTRVNWKQFGKNEWGYDWEPSQEIVKWQFGKSAKDGEENENLRFPRGIVVTTRVLAKSNEVDLTLKITNKTQNMVRGLSSDGCCLQANSDLFTDKNEVARSYVMRNGEMISMDKLHRSVSIRTTYYTSTDDIPEKGSSFWGKSTSIVDSPTIVGAVSNDRSHAIVLGFEKSISASQNSNQNHHCLHSRPFLGDLTGKKSKTVKGYILFGNDIQTLGEQLKNKLKV